MKDKFEIKIEHGIPVGEGTNYGLIYEVLKKMKPGDSFVYPLEKRSTVISSAHRHGIKIVTRSLGGHTVRIWRVK